MSDTPNTTAAPVDTTSNTGGESGQPDFANMTGEQAKAWVEAQKAREAAKGEKPRQADGKFAAQPKPQTNQEAIKEAAAVAAEKRRLKIDDQEIDEDEVIKVYRERKGHQQAANRELQEGKAARKQAEQFIAMMRDPEKFFDVAAKMGHTPRELAEKYLARQLQEELMDPKDRELRDAKAKIREIEDLERRQREYVEQQQAQLLREKYMKDYESQFVQALQDSQLPATKEMVARMAKYIGQATKLNYKMSPAEAAQLVQEDLQTSYKKLVASSDGDMLIKLLGEDVANKLRKYDVEKLKDPSKLLQTPNQHQEPRKDRSRVEKRMSAKEWREYNRK